MKFNFTCDQIQFSVILSNFGKDIFCPTTSTEDIAGQSLIFDIDIDIAEQSLIFDIDISDVKKITFDV